MFPTWWAGARSELVPPYVKKAMALPQNGMRTLASRLRSNEARECTDGSGHEAVTVAGSASQTGIAHRDCEAGHCGRDPFDAAPWGAPPFPFDCPALPPPFHRGSKFAAAPLLEPAPAGCEPLLGHAPLKGRDPLLGWLLGTVAGSSHGAFA